MSPVFQSYYAFFLPSPLLHPHKQSLGGILESACPSIGPCVTKSCPGQNLKRIKASNFKLDTHLGHIVEKCTVQKP